MKRLLTFVLLLVALLHGGCATPDEDDKYVGSTAPDFQVQTLSVPSSSVSLGKRRGKVVLIDYWATWCGPCRQITPALESIYVRHKDAGLEAMAITDEERRVVDAFEKVRPHTMPVVLDEKDEAHEKLGIKALPTIMVIDREGHIAYRTVGAPEDPSEIEAAVEKALRK